MKRILLFIFLFIFACNVAIADDLIAPIYTKFSVKMVKPFEELSQGETLKFLINPRTLKNKKINWSPLNLSENSRPFFVGTVMSVKAKPYKRTDGTISYILYAKFDINELVADGKSYKINGSFEDSENSFTYNYSLTLNSELKMSDFNGEFIDNIDEKNVQLKEKEKEEEKEKINNKTISEKVEQKKEVEVKRKQVYIKHFYNAANACIPTIQVGSQASDPLWCFSRTLKDPSLYEEGVIHAELPYAYAMIYPLYRQFYNLGGPNAAIAHLTMPIALWIKGCEGQVIDEETYKRLYYGEQ